jgi:Cu/Ag efflux protein CusF
MTRINKFAIFGAMALLFVVAAPKGRANANAARQNDDNRLIDVQSASGKISAVQQNTFTIEIEHVKPPGAGFQQEQHTSSMTFQVTPSTKIQGKLEVGANADVVYRPQEGKNVAVSVQVTAIS